MTTIWLKKYSTNPDADYYGSTPIYSKLDENPIDWCRISLHKFRSMVSGPTPAYLHFQSVHITVIEIWRYILLDKAMFSELFRPLASAFVNTRLFFGFCGKHFNSGSDLLDYLDSTLLPIFRLCREFELRGSDVHNKYLEEE